MCHRRTKFCIHPLNIAQRRSPNQDIRLEANTAYDRIRHQKFRINMLFFDAVAAYNLCVRVCTPNKTLHVYDLANCEDEKFVRRTFRI